MKTKMMNKIASMIKAPVDAFMRARYLKQEERAMSKGTMVTSTTFVDPIIHKGRTRFNGATSVGKARADQRTSQGKVVARYVARHSWMKKAVVASPSWLKEAV